MEINLVNDRSCLEVALVEGGVVAGDTRLGYVEFGIGERINSLLMSAVYICSAVATL